MQSASFTLFTINKVFVSVTITINYNTKNIFVNSLFNRLCDLSLNNILSRLKRSGNRIEECGSTAEFLQTRTLRYAIATQDANSHNPLFIE